MRGIGLKRAVRLARWLVRHYGEYVPEHVLRERAEAYGVSRGELLLILRSLRELHQTFPEKGESWYFRAVVRLLAGVERVGDRVWRVRGLRELGDEYPEYRVWLTRDGRYECECYHRKWGHTRKSRICTHIAAVILSRRLTRPIEEYRE